MLRRFPQPLQDRVCFEPLDPPDAVDDMATTIKATAVNIPVLINDTDVDNDVLTVTDVTQAANGTVIINMDGTVSEPRVPLTFVHIVVQ